MLAIAITSCKKENTNAHLATGTIYFGGPLSGDGCDWNIELPDGKYYHPLSLNNDYLINGQKVIVNYTLTTDTFKCGWSVGIPIININSIKKL
jgi:hypothetical protein